MNTGYYTILVNSHEKSSLEINIDRFTVLYRPLDMVLSDTLHFVTEESSLLASFSGRCTQLL